MEEPTKRRKKNSEFEAVRVMLLTAQLDSLVKQAEGICNIVPLKGIALLQTLYKDSLDREVGDIDLLVWPKERARDYVNRLQADGYVPQFDFLADDSTLAEKNKMALCSPRKERTDVDIHLAFVTKKFFSRFSEDFNRDAIIRCQKAGENLYYMDEVDQWIFLAQHACFHLYRDGKWTKDLLLLRRTMTEEQVAILHKRAVKYGFQRIVFLTLRWLNECFDEYFPLGSEPPSSCWDKFTLWSVRNWRSRLVKRLVNPFWELICIDKAAHRCAAHRSLVFPNLQQLKTIYRTKYIVLTLLVYPFHVLFAGLGLLLFYVLYVLAVFRKG